MDVSVIQKAVCKSKQKPPPDEGVDACRETTANQWAQFGISSGAYRERAKTVGVIIECKLSRLFSKRSSKRKKSLQNVNKLIMRYPEIVTSSNSLVEELID